MRNKGFAGVAERRFPRCGELLESGRLVRRELEDGSEVYQVEKDFAKIRSAENGGISIVASDATVDRYGDIVDPRGWDLTAYMTNPVLLVDHDYRVESIVGHASTAYVEDHALKVLARLDDKGTNAKATMVRNLIEQGSLRTTSVGFAPVEYHAMMRGVQDKCPVCVGHAKGLAGAEGDYRDVYLEGLHFTKQELLELSFVAVPANPSALIDNSVDDGSEKLRGLFSRARLATMLLKR